MRSQIAAGTLTELTAQGLDLALYSTPPVPEHIDDSTHSSTHGDTESHESTVVVDDVLLEPALAQDTTLADEPQLTTDVELTKIPRALHKSSSIRDSSSVHKRTREESRPRAASRSKSKSTVVGGDRIDVVQKEDRELGSVSGGTSMHMSRMYVYVCI